MRPPAASEPRRHSMGPRGHHHAGQPSSPTAFAPSHRSEHTHESHADLPNARRSAVASSSRLSTSAGPQGGQTNDPFLVDSSDDDVENEENDENLPPPRTAVDPDKRFESAGPPRATALAPVTRAAVASSSSSRGAARGQQANGHPSSRTPQFPRRASKHLGEDDEEAEDIEQFSSPNSPTEPRQSKGKGKAPAPPDRPHAARARQRMQDRNGNAATEEVSLVDMAELTQQARWPPPSKPASTTPQIPSSTGSVPGSVKAFYIESMDRPGQLTHLKLEWMKKELVFRIDDHTTRRIPVTTIAWVTVGQVCVRGANPRLARTTASSWSSFSTKDRCGN